MFKPNTNLRLGGPPTLQTVIQYLIGTSIETVCCKAGDIKSYEKKNVQISEIAGKSLRGISSQVCNFCAGLLYIVSLRT